MQQMETDQKCSLEMKYAYEYVILSLYSPSVSLFTLHLLIKPLNRFRMYGFEWVKRFLEQHD